MKKAFLFVKNAVEGAGFNCVPAYCGDAVERIKQNAALDGRCTAVSFESAEIASANAGFRVREISVAVFYACELSLAENGAHLDDIEKLFSALHALRLDNKTLQCQNVQLVDRATFLVYRLDFNF